MKYFVWLIPILPALAALLNGLFGEKIIRRKAGHLASAAIIGSFILSLAAFLLFVQSGDHPSGMDIEYYAWMTVEDFQIPIGFYIDQLALVMMSVVSFVSAVIFIYAVGYMRDDPGCARFFTYMPLFTFFMLLLVMADSLPILFIGWEGVGLCSYLLIGYYYDRDYAADAGTKAFLVNRIGDFGFLLAMLMLYCYTETLQFSRLSDVAPTLFAQNSTAITVITLLLFLGATGKSAQVPLYVWLPDAMAGPTPV
ncbi:MAG: NADH-quinone oxidoreductase subunit L, partial [Candidatus Omnitrophica bacterium]|nr:NADH-quinone oxidoreductase subunit L [Candidatus Omnitrophota bacterium]